MKQKFIPILIVSVMLAFVTCGGCGNKTQDNSQPEVSGNENIDPGLEKQESSEKGAGTSAKSTLTDPSGAEITIPGQIDSIVVMAPSLSQIVADLGMGDKIVGYDTYSIGLEGLPEDVPTFDTSNPDMEQLAALSPDMLLTSNLTLYDQESPYQSLIDAGTCVICVPSSDDIEDIKSDIGFLATALDASEAGDALLDEFNAQLDELAGIAANIPKESRKRVYFEIAPAPNMYSFGSDVYLDEMIEWIGAENILASQTGWLTVEGETVVAENPDVIFTNVGYTDDPVQEILDRSGWAGISAIANKDVYYIDKDSSSQPNHNIIKAMRQMAEILYPDFYAPK